MNTHDSILPPISNILDRISDGIVVFDREMNYTFVNKRAGELLGRKPEELISKNYWKEYPEAKGTPFANAYLKALETQQPIIFEDYYQPWNRWFENRIHPSEEGLIIFFTEITERKQREQMLLERERQFSALINNLPGAVFRVRNDPNYTVEYVSDQIAELTGYPADDFRENRRNFRDLMHPDDREWVWNEIQKALKEHRPYEVTYRFIDAYGKVRWNWERGMGIFDAKGELQAVEGFVQDITERKRAEETVKESEARWQSYVSNAPNIILTVDRDYKITFMNYTLPGYSLEDVLGVSMFDFLPAESKEIAKRALDKVFDTGERQVYEVLSHGIHGNPAWYSTSVGPIKKDDKVVSAILVATDITERKQAEEKLHESEVRFRSLITNSADGIVLFKKNGVISFASPSTEKILGYSSDESVGRSVFELIHPKDQVSVKRKLLELLRHPETPVQIEVRLRHKNGSWRYLEGTLTNLIHVPSVKAIVNNFRDITDRKRAEETLRRSEEKFSVIFRKAPYAAALVNVSDRVIEDVNEEHERLFELSREELIGKTPEMLDMVIEAEQRKRIATLIREHGFVTNEQLTLQLRSGAKIDILLSANLVHIGGKAYLLTVTKD
ncbi:MAG TPA: PAS domain S-box protein, partial [Bacteroidota bacterium]|nr:PAS domain S-box protein [Bacteroidota bacterium]